MLNPMKFIPDARHVALKLWSVRLMLLSICLSGLEVAIPYIAPVLPSGSFAALAGLVTVAAAIARLVAQPALSGE